jgi:phospholipid/cholesterol/gamma-HCH transport system substrate-binding protein
MRRAFALGAVVVAAVAVIVVLASGGGGGYRVRAEFRDIEGIHKNYWVRVNGAVAGVVEDVQVTRQDAAVATIRLDRGVAPIGAGARAEVRPANLLGEKYVQIERGNLSRPQPSGTTIPLTRTTTSVELDDILNMLAPTTRAQLRILINEAGIAMEGRGADFNALLRQLPGSLSGARSVLAELAAENGRLGDLINQADLAVGPIDQRRSGVTDFISHADTALSAVADKRTQLAATIRSAPAALGQITSTLDRLGVAAQGLKPAASLLSDAAPYLSRTLQELPDLASSVHSPLATATRVAPDLTRLGSAGTPALARLTPTVALLADLAGRAQPLVHALGRAGGADGVMGILSNWSKTAIYQDGISHFFDFHVSISQRLLTDAVQRFIGAGASTRATPRSANSQTTLRPAGSQPPQQPSGATPAGARPGTAGPASSKSPVQALLQQLAPASSPAPLSSLLSYLLGR